MTRLTDLSGGRTGSPAGRWDPRSVDVHSLVQTARAERSRFIADHLHRGLAAFGRLSGLSGLVVRLRHRRQCRRTLQALSALDNRLLSDIGVARADIEATATLACGPAVSGPSIWQMLAARIGRRRRLRATERALAAVSDEILSDIGISRAEIPAVAAAVCAAEHDTVPAGDTAGEAAVSPTVIPAQVLAVVQLRRSLQRAANQNLDHSSAA